MQACAQTAKAGAVPRSAAPRAARSAQAVRCHAVPRFFQEAGKGAALAAAAASLVLGSGLPAEASKAGPSAYEQRSAYEQELLSSLKARGTALPELNSRPEGVVDKKADRPAFKLNDVPKVVFDTPASVPVPAPAAPAAVEAPKPAPVVAAPAPAPKPAPVVAAPVAEAPKPAAAVAVAPAAASAPAANDAPAGPPDNKSLLAGAAIAAVAIAAVVSTGAQGNMEGAVAGGAGSSSDASSPTPAAPASANGVPPDVAEARKWIAAWKAKSAK